MSLEADSCLIGKRVRIRAIKREGSARILNGVAAVVTGRHPIAPEWYTIELEENDVTPERRWTIPGNRLIVCDSELL